MTKGKKPGEGDPPRPQNQLSVLLKERSQQDRLSLGELAVMFGLSPSYFSALIYSRGWGSVGRETFELITEYLQIPFSNVLLLAGNLRAEDFFVENNIEKSLEGVRVSMVQSDKWCGFAPSYDEWQATPIKSRIAMAMLFLDSVKSDIAAG
jgi:hypothetical protein